MKTIRLADLVGSSVKDESGNDMGHVIDIVVDPDDDYALTELVLGAAGWVDRLDIQRALPKLAHHPRSTRIPWSRVDRFEDLTIHLKVEER